MTTIAACCCRLTLVAAGAIGLLGIASPARGQDALGSGNALDANTRVGSGGVNTTSRVPNFRARNLLVTGDVPGGRGFRGSVGYRAEGDFIGRLGSDDLFRFRAVSALSAPGFVRYGETAQSLRFGEQLGRLTYRRSAAPSVAVAETRPPTGDEGTLANRVRLDRVIQSRGVTEPAFLDSSDQVIGQAVDTTGQMMALRVSGLRGVTVRPTDTETRPDGFSEYDWLRLKQDETEGRQLAAGEPFETRFDRLGGMASAIEPSSLGAAPESAIVETRMTSTLVTEHDDILERIAERFVEEAEASADADDDAATTADQLAELKAQYDLLRERLMPDEARAPVSDGAADERRGTDGVAEPTPVGEAERLEALRPRGAGVAGASQAGVDRFGIVLRHGERIDRLASSDEGRFNELLRSGEDRLRRGEYFWAERRFLRALRFVPGHPLATAGLGHAQLGAGLYESAALTLRSLLMHQPEMIDTRYDESLLPNRVRLLTAIEEIRSPSEMSQGESTGFLLAYVGHQLDDAELVSDGLRMMEEAKPASTLRPLLEAVWVDDPAPGDGREETEVPGR